MLNFVLMAIMILACVVVLWSAMKLFQLRGFSRFMDKEIDRLFASDEWRTKDLDIAASYRNYSRSFPWKRNFSSMVVYSGR